MPLPARVRTALFAIAAAICVAAAVFHLLALANPSIARLEYTPDYPVWRHWLFVAGDLILAWLFIRRPPWLIFVFGALTLQIFMGHGRWAWRLWRVEHRPDWISIAVVLAAVVGVILLAADRSDRI